MPRNRGPRKPFKYTYKARRPKANGYRPPPSSRERSTNWVSVTMRAEHYTMLREVGDFYEAPISKVVATMVVKEYCRLLNDVDPVTAQRIKEAYEDDEKHTGQLLDLAD
jgi:hypothetical protein